MNSLFSHSFIFYFSPIQYLYFVYVSSLFLGAFIHFHSFPFIHSSLHPYDVLFPFIHPIHSFSYNIFILNTFNQFYYILIPSFQQHFLIVQPAFCYFFASLCLSQLILLASLFLSQLIFLASSFLSQFIFSSSFCLARSFFQPAHFSAS